MLCVYVCVLCVCVCVFRMQICLHDHDVNTSSVNDVYIQTQEQEGHQYCNE